MFFSFAYTMVYCSLNRISSNLKCVTPQQTQEITNNNRCVKYELKFVW